MDKYGGQLFETLKMKVKSSLGGGQLADCSAMPFAFKIQISLFERLSNGQLEAATEKSRVSQGERRPTHRPPKAAWEEKAACRSPTVFTKTSRWWVVSVLPSSF